MENLNTLGKQNINELVNNLISQFDLVSMIPFSNCSSIGGGPGFTIMARDLEGAVSINIDRPASDLLEMTYPVKRMAIYDLADGGYDQDSIILTSNQVHERWFGPDVFGFDDFNYNDENVHIGFYIEKVES